MRIILSGGGTGGSVTPLLAVAREIKARVSEVEFLFVGTRKGIPERELASFAGIPFQSIFSGKLRRYFDWRNIASPFLIKLGFIQSLFIILKTRPAAIISVGGFVSVPLVWAGRALRVPVFIHQQDVTPGLANKLMAPFARIITVSFEKSLADFPRGKPVLTGNPVRPEILKGDKKRALKKFNLEPNLPTLLVIGGGTGAKRINQLISEIASELAKFCQVIHLTGRNKFQVSSFKFQVSPRYHQYEFLTEEMADAYAIADLVISRAGMGVLTELAHLSKPTILIPIPRSHQIANGQYFARKNAAVLLDEEKLTPEILLENIRQLLFSANKRSILSLNISKLVQPEAAQKIARYLVPVLEGA